MGLCSCLCSCFQKPGCRSCLSNSILGVCATLYLVLGVVLMMAGGFALSTEVSQIVPTTYGATLMGGGAAIFTIACIGLCAACDTKGRVRPLWIFTLLTLVMIAFTLGAVVVCFQYERVLALASDAGGQVAAGRVDRAVEHASVRLDSNGAAVIETLATNAFTACGAVVNTTANPSVFNFACTDDEFALLADSINGTCMNPDVTASIDTTIDPPSAFVRCYSGNAMPDWPATVPLDPGSGPTDVSLLDALNTPKGLFCACSSTIIDTYLLPYLQWAKWCGCGVAVFFVLVFVACVHQICQRGCCGRNERDKKRDFSDIQMTYPSDNPKKGAKRLDDRDGGYGGYIARP